jgi:hypothetical protein
MCLGFVACSRGCKTSVQVMSPNPGDIRHVFGICLLILGILDKCSCLLIPGISDICVGYVS